MRMIKKLKIFLITMKRGQNQSRRLEQKFLGRGNTYIFPFFCKFSRFNVHFFDFGKGVPLATPLKIILDLSVFEELKAI